jgi:predicted transcriptional regulator
MLLPKKNWSRMEIISSVLESAKEHTPKSHLLYKAYISWPQLLDYLLLLANSLTIGHAKGDYRTRLDGRP